VLRHREASRFAPFRLFNAGFTRASNAYASAVRHFIAARWFPAAYSSIVLSKK
jgi:hypothetical protein